MHAYYSNCHFYMIQTEADNAIPLLAIMRALKENKVICPYYILDICDANTFECSIATAVQQVT